MVPATQNGGNHFGVSDCTDQDGRATTLTVKATTNSKHDLPVAPNQLNQNFSVSAPNQAWCGDITYIATDEGWLYLAGLKDLFSGELVGYAMSERMTKHLVMQALYGRSRRTDHRPA
ncbi:hypothetical protein PTKU46_86180 [Paraburkholderia terrae]